ncbi:MAG: hypothetical protein LCH26_04470 [Proteobacteria bacterium]|nr:hypothetical protein [Pseudomonadota bacterium]
MKTSLKNIYGLSFAALMCAGQLLASDGSEKEIVDTHHASCSSSSSTPTVMIHSLEDSIYLEALDSAEAEKERKFPFGQLVLYARQKVEQGTVLPGAFAVFQQEAAYQEVRLTGQAPHSCVSTLEAIVSQTSLGADRDTAITYALALAIPEAIDFKGMLVLLQGVIGVPLMIGEEPMPFRPFVVQGFLKNLPLASLSLDIYKQYLSRAEILRGISSKMQIGLGVDTGLSLFRQFQQQRALPSQSSAPVSSSATDATLGEKEAEPQTL